MPHLSRSNRFGVLTAVTSCFCIGLCSAQEKPYRTDGVYEALPERISFARVAPLLDALYSDANAIQLQQLTIGATAANSSNLDARMQSMQVAASFNTLDAIANAANAQLIQSNAALQNSIISQIIALNAQVVPAQATANSALQALNAIKAQTNPAATDDQIKPYQQASDTAAAQVISIQTQLAALQKSQSAVSLSAFTSTTPAQGTNAAGGSTAYSSKLLGTNLFSASSPSINNSAGTSIGPSLPPSRQMETQLGLLWDRAMRLLSTLGQPDSEQDVSFELLRFYPSIKYADKKTESITLEYTLSCAGGSGPAPKILDLYPRTAPVNILNEKMRDRSWSLAALLGFGGANASANYNWEHLQLTNSMAQTSYITGYGAGSATFGWMIGRTLGDDTIAPGQREMYALVAVPNGCSTDVDGEKFKVTASQVRWQGKDNIILDRVSPNFTAGYKLDDPLNLESPDINIAYSQVDSGSVASITLDLGRPLDPEARIIVNGSVLTHARDSFGRATASAATAASNSLFDTQPGSLSAGTWARTATNELTITLDAKSYPTAFPSILIDSPTFTANLPEAINDVKLNGMNYGYAAGDIFPGLLRPQPPFSPGQLHGGRKEIASDLTTAFLSPWIAMSLP